MSRLFALAAVAAIAVTGPARAAVDIVEVESPGGVTAWLVEEHELPFVALEILFRGGTSLDDPDARGAVNLMTGLLEEGAGELDARGFAEARDDLAVSFRFDAGDDTISVSAEFLTDVTDEATALLRTALAEPRFDEDAVERVRAQVLSRLRSDAEDPGEIATETFAAKLYGAHPYATNGRGTIESVTALSRDDLVAAHAGTIARDRVYVGAVGDITPEQLGVLLDTLFADLPETGAPLPERVDISLDGGVHVTPYATPQSSILFAQGGIDREHPDFFPAFVMNQVLGAGGFGSRLMTEVREKRGLTYGIYAYLAQKDHADLLIGRVATANATVGETIDIVRAEWQRMADEGVTEAELTQAKTYLTGAYPLRFDGNGRIANILAGMQIDGMPIDYINTRNAKVDAVTLEDVNRVAGELLNPEALTFVVVGQPEEPAPAN
ncbi:MAG: insulinase family protein [Rhodobacteraceae bacterium]|nr:insulinase family protein [Paracoccaceae bacterium]